MRGVKILMALIAVSSLALVGWLPQRVRAATCYGASCDGLDPVTTGCSSDAIVISSGPIDDIYFGSGQIGTVYYRWSPTCQAGYAETVTEEGNAAFIQARIWGSSANYFRNANNTSNVKSPLLSASSSCDLYATGIIRLGAVGSSPTGVGNTGNGCTP